MSALQEHITSDGMTEAQAAEVLGVTTSRFFDLMHDKLYLFTLDAV